MPALVTVSRQRTSSPGAPPSPPVPSTVANAPADGKSLTSWNPPTATAQARPQEQEQPRRVDNNAKRSPDRTFANGEHRQRTAPSLPRKLSEKTVRAQHVSGWEGRRPSPEPGGADGGGDGDRSTGKASHFLPVRDQRKKHPPGSEEYSRAKAKINRERRRREEEKQEEGRNGVTSLRAHSGDRARKYAIEKSDERNGGWVDHRGVTLRIPSNQDERNGRNSLEKGGKNGVAKRLNVEPSRGSEDDDDGPNQHGGGLGWIPEAGLDTSRILSGERRRASKPEVFTYEEMPRNYARSPTKARSRDAASSSREGDGVRTGCSVGGMGTPGTPGSTREEKQERDRQKYTDKVKSASGRVSNSTKQRVNDGGDKKNRTTSISISITGTAAGSGGSRHAKGAVSGAMPPRERNQEWESSSSMPPSSAGSGDSMVDDEDDDYTDATGADVDTDTGSPAVWAVNGPREKGRNRADDTTDSNSSTGRRPPADTVGASSPPPSRKRALKPAGSQAQRQIRSVERDRVILTYVTHEQPDMADEDSGEACLTFDLRKRGSGENGTTSGRSSGWRRNKRPRPNLQGASTRAVVWSEPCAACRGEQGRAGVVKEEGNSVASVGNGDSCPSRGGNGEAGGGPVRPGQYVYLRTAGCEDVRRSLWSDGEFAAPHPGGLSRAELAGTRIRVWRQVCASSGDGTGGVTDVIGTFAEADVVKFDPTSGKHRVRFVTDGTVEDLTLMKAEGGHDRGKGSPASGVRWLQTRTRPRTRDTVQRNAAGLCEGPDGEMRGLIGDEHDPAAQRQENWRWAMSRWRWKLGERDGYSADGEGPCGVAGRDTRTRGDRSFDERSGVPPAGDGMFPPIGRVLAVERRQLSTGENICEGEASGMPGKRDTGDTFLKVARLWYPQDTSSGMDPFVHGKAEVFEACRVVVPSANGADRERGARAKNCGSQSEDFKCSVSEGSKLGAEPTNERNEKPASKPCHSCRRTVGVRDQSTAGATTSCKRLDAGQPLRPHPKLEPVVLWVRACEVRRLASVHPCLDGRLNPCAGKVVNDPYQPQAEFFLSHRYCLELDAYFPIESVKSPAAANSDSAGDCNVSSPRSGDEAGRGNHSPRSTKARLLNRGVSDGVYDLPPKWHPLKKRMSLDQATSAAAVAAGTGGGGRDSPVVGWESVVGRGIFPKSVVGSSATVEEAGASLAAANALSTPFTTETNNAQDVYLCHRCRHALPSSSLMQCLGRGCGNRFCSPCAAGREGLRDGKGARRHPARWPGGPSNTAGALFINAGLMGEANGSGIDKVHEPWVGPCCQGHCGCRECAAASDEGLLSGWRARNGLSYVHTTPGMRPEVEHQPAPLPSRSSGDPAAVRWSGWQGRQGTTAMRRGDAATGNGRIAGGGGNSPAVGASLAVVVATEAGNTEEEMGEGHSVEIGIEWCSSCSGPGPSGSLIRCYYCRGGVHASGCRRFEETLTKRRLAEHGIGPTGQLAEPPTGEAAVGHGVAVCVRHRWRPALVLCWSPTLGAHYLRYVDGASKEGTTEVDLGTIPWDGEWVTLPTSDRTERGKSGRGASRRGNQRQERPSIAMQASSVRWPLVDVAVRLFPPPVGTTETVDTPADDAVLTSARPVAAPPPPAPESRPAVKVLKGLLKQTWLASQAASKSDGGTGGDTRVTQKYRPPAVALPACWGEKQGGGDVQSRGNNKKGPWVCRRCVEGKLQRLQRRIRFQFQPALKMDDVSTLVEVPARPPSAASPAAEARRNASAVAADQHPASCEGVTHPPLPSPRPPPSDKTVLGAGSSVAGWLQRQSTTDTTAYKRQREGSTASCMSVPQDGNGATDRMTPATQECPGGNSAGELVTTAISDGGAMAEAAMTEAAAAATEATKKQEHYRQALRRAQGDRRLRWLQTGNPGSTLPFAYEAGFVSDLSAVHAHEGLTASGSTAGGGGLRRGGGGGGGRGKKRPRPPPVARAMAHLLGGLESQRPLAFALPPDITGLDRDMLAFFANGRSGEEAGVGRYARAGGPSDDAISDRSIVLVNGTVALPLKAVSGGKGTDGGTGVGAVVMGAATARATNATIMAGRNVVQLPAGFFATVKEVDLESSARIRPLDANKQRRMRSSSWGGEL